MDRRIEQVSLGRAIIEIAQWRLNIHIENWVQYVAVTWVYLSYMYMYPSRPVDPWIVPTCIVVFGCLSYSESTRLVTYSVCLSFLCSIYSDTPRLSLDLCVWVTHVPKLLGHSRTIPGCPHTLCLSILRVHVCPTWPTHSVSDYSIVTWTLPDYPWMSNLPLYTVSTYRNSPGVSQYMYTCNYCTVQGMLRHEVRVGHVGHSGIYSLRVSKYSCQWVSCMISS